MNSLVSFEQTPRDGIDPELIAALDPIRIELPPLRERAEDLPAFVGLFWKHYSAKNDALAMSLSDEARHALAGMKLDGNVRELACRIEAGIVRARWRGRNEVAPADR